MTASGREENRATEIAEISRSLKSLGVDVPEEKHFSGLDAYQKVLDSGVDVLGHRHDDHRGVW